MSRQIRQAVLLVGGLGTRLGELTATTPKPLLSVGGRPFLDWLLEEVARHGLRHILLVAAHFGQQIHARYHDRQIRGARVQVIIEPSPAGTGGALRFALQQLEPRFFLLNGDSHFAVNLLALAQTAADAPLHLALKRTSPGRRYGRVDVRDGRVTAFVPPGPGDQPINAGVYVASRAIAEEIGPGRVSLETDLLPRLAAAGRLTAHLDDGFFLDIGVPEDLARAQIEIPEQARRNAVILDRDGVLNRDIGYAHRPDQIEWMPGAIATVRRFNDAGWFVFVVTNQAGVAHGYYGEKEVHALHAWMADELAEAGAHIDAFAYCPSHPQAAVPAYRRHDRRRKPEPGMILDLLAEWPVRLSGTFLVGDQDKDLAAAAAAGLPSLHYAGGDLLGLCCGYARLPSARGHPTTQPGGNN